MSDLAKLTTKKAMDLAITQVFPDSVELKASKQEIYDLLTAEEIARLEGLEQRAKVEIINGRLLAVTALMNAYYCGEALVGIRDLLQQKGRGLWSNWLKNCFASAVEIGWENIRVYEAINEHGGKELFTANPMIDKTAVLKLIARTVPQHIKDFFWGKVLAGEPLSFGEVSQAIKANKNFAGEGISPSSLPPAADDESQDSKEAGIQLDLFAKNPSGAGKSVSKQSAQKNARVSEPAGLQQTSGEASPSVAQIWQAGEFVCFKMDTPISQEGNRQLQWCQNCFGQVINFDGSRYECNVAGRSYWFSAHELQSAPGGESARIQLERMHRVICSICNHPSYWEMGLAAKAAITETRKRTIFTDREVDFMVAIAEFWLDDFKVEEAVLLLSALIGKEGEIKRIEVEEVVNAPEASQSLDSIDEDADFRILMEELTHEKLIEMAKKEDKVGRIKMCKYWGLSTKGTPQMLSKRLVDFFKECQASECQ